MIIGLVGAGHIGTALARNALRAGHRVVLSNSRGPETLTDLVAELGDGASAATSAEAAAAGEVVVVTVPLKNALEVPVGPLAGKVVIDTDNYYYERDGRMVEIDEGRTAPSELLQAHLPTSLVVKAFNQITAAALAEGGHGTPGPRAIPIAGDDERAKAVVADLVRSFGFDVVDAGPLAAGRSFDRDAAGYRDNTGADDLRAQLAGA